MSRRRYKVIGEDKYGITVMELCKYLQQAVDVGKKLNNYEVWDVFGRCYVAGNTPFYKKLQQAKEEAGI
jgi:hypothetical protein